MSDDWDESNDAAWFAQQRESVLDYLRRQNVEHGDVPTTPAWHISPYVALWPIGSCATPGAVGWWAISGDLPTDYCSSSEGRTQREAARHFSESWMEAVRDPREDGTLGTSGLPVAYRDLLAGRAQTLADFVDDDAVWLIAEEGQT